MSRQAVTLRYQVQTQRGDEWVTVAQESSRAWCQGYLARVRDERGVRNAWRLLDTKTGRVVESESVRERADVSLGMIAGWPTAEQYEQAAERALARAREIREREALHEQRRLGRVSGTMPE